jgi:hypothetical protein
MLPGIGAISRPNIGGMNMNILYSPSMIHALSLSAQIEQWHDPWWPKPKPSNPKLGTPMIPMDTPNAECLIPPKRRAFTPTRENSRAPIFKIVRNARQSQEMKMKERIHPGNMLSTPPKMRKESEVTVLIRPEQVGHFEKVEYIEPFNSVNGTQTVLDQRKRFKFVYPEIPMNGKTIVNLEVDQKLK